MGFSVAVDCAVAKAAAVVGDANGVGDTIDNSSQRKLTAAHNETLNSRRETLNNSDGELNDARRHCDVGYLRAALHNSDRTLMNFDGSSLAAARASDFHAVASAVDASDIHRKVRCNDAVD